MTKDRRHDPKKPPRADRSTARPTDSTLRNLKDFVVEEIELGGVTPVGPSVHKQKKPLAVMPWWRNFMLRIAVTGLALLAVVAALATRTAWPTDETRFLAIAWEMWARHDLLVPHLNGSPTSVAPMFFWLVQLGWSAAGVQEWWPRLIPALFMLASLFIAPRVAALLWPSEEPWARRVPFVLLGSFYWLASTTLLTPDFLTVFFTLLAVHALLWMWRTRDQRVWLLLGLELGLGLLASGSLILLYVLPIALLAPLWTGGTRTMPWSYWYADLFKAVVLAFGIFALWFVPAAARVKVATLAPLLSAPFASHALDLYDGARPWWWLLVLLPAVAFPWSLWPLPWVRLWDIRREPISNGLTFCMLWGTVTVAVFLLSPVRQPQLLLPLAPAFFLAAAWLVLDDRLEKHDHSRLATSMVFPLMLLGGVLAVLPKLPRVEFLPDVLWQLSPFVGAAIIVVGVAAGSLPLPSLSQRVTNMTVTVSVLTTLALLALGWQFNDRHHVQAAAQKIASAQQQGQTVAHVGPYTGQFHFHGRLSHPLVQVSASEAETWVIAHPDAIVVTTVENWQPRTAGTTPLFDQEYTDTRLRLWSTTGLADAAAAASHLPASP